LRDGVKDRTIDKGHLTRLSKDGIDNHDLTVDGNRYILRGVGKYTRGWGSFPRQGCTRNKGGATRTQLRKGGYPRLRKGSVERFDDRVLRSKPKVAMVWPITLGHPIGIPPNDLLGNQDIIREVSEETTSQWKFVEAVIGSALAHIRTIQVDPYHLPRSVGGEQSWIIPTKIQNPLLQRADYLPVEGRHGKVSCGE